MIPELPGDRNLRLLTQVALWAKGVPCQQNARAGEGSLVRCGCTINKRRQLCGPCSAREVLRLLKKERPLMPALETFFPLPQRTSGYALVINGHIIKGQPFSAAEAGIMTAAQDEAPRQRDSKYVIGNRPKAKKGKKK